MKDMRRILALLFSVAFVGAFPVLFYKAIPEANKDLVTYMLGQLSGIVGTILAFHFSSTVGGEEKTRQLVDTLAGQNQPGRTDTMEVEADQVTVTPK